ncbi:MAG TPA: DinB family protein [Acidimicrobiia bacterium]
MTKADLIELSDEVWQRTRARVEGLTDDEYFWEPAPGCWSIRQRDNGTWFMEWPLPRPDPEPFTTIAWRLWHLIDMYGEDRAPRWLAVPPQGVAVGLDAPDPQPPPTAAIAVSMLEQAHARWDAHLSIVSEDALTEPIGRVAGPQYATAPRTAYVLHMLDEFIHHGAEIATLRDLWRWQRSISSDEQLERIARGDASALDGKLTEELVDQAAAYGRWELVTELVRRGAPLTRTGRTPLHVAAGAGELDVVQLLLDHGADPTAIDPEYHATPRQWAEFLRHPPVVALFDRVAAAPEPGGK